MTLSDADIDESTGRRTKPGAARANRLSTGSSAGTKPQRAESGDDPPACREIQRILGLSLPITATLAERDMTVQSILALTPGSIIEFDVPCDAELTLSVANHSIGRGKAVKAGENFGIRITAVNSVQERIDAMRGS